MKLRNEEATNILAALAFADTGFLVTLLTANLKHYNYDLFNESLIGCKLTIYFNYVFSFLSVWYVLTIFCVKLHPNQSQLTKILKF